MAYQIIGKAPTRPFLLLFLLIWHFFPLTGQTIPLPVNSEGRIEYSDTIRTDSGSYPVLWANAENFLNTLSIPGKLNKEAQADETLTRWIHRFGFYLYIKPALTKQIDGVVLADITIIISDTGYQYQMINFRFVEYARDRFGQFTPKSSKEYPLERYIPKSDKTKWAVHFKAIDEKMADLTENLKAKMSEIRKSH